MKTLKCLRNANKNKLNESKYTDKIEGMALAQIFCANVTQRITQAPKGAESNELDANEGMALARIFVQNVTQQVPQAPKGAESNELDANESTALTQIFRTKRDPTGDPSSQGCRKQRNRCKRR